MVVLFLTEKLPVDVTAFAGLVAAGRRRVGDKPDEAFKGFASPAVITMLSVFFVSAGLQYTGVAERLGAQDSPGRRQPGDARSSLRSCSWRECLSAFMNNIAAAAVLLAGGSRAWRGRQGCPLPASHAAGVRRDSRRNHDAGRNAAKSPRIPGPHRPGVAALRSLRVRALRPRAACRRCDLHGHHRAKAPPGSQRWHGRDGAGQPRRGLPARGEPVLDHDSGQLEARRHDPG